MKLFHNSPEKELINCDEVFRNQAENGDYHYEQSLKIVANLDF